MIDTANESGFDPDPRLEEKALVELDEESGGAGEHAEGAIVRREEARLVHAALDLLPPRYNRHTLTGDTLSSPRVNLAWRIGESR